MDYGNQQSSRGPWIRLVSLRATRTGDAALLLVDEAEELVGGKVTT
jgi:hypothetical protein